MKLIRLFLILSALIFANNSSYAQLLRCVGLDSEGNTIYAMLDTGTETLNINGSVLRIRSGTRGHNGVATEDYDTIDGKHVYASMVVSKENDSDIDLYQFDSASDEPLAKVPLACHKEVET